MIERVIQMVSTGSYPSSGEGLARFATDAQHYLSQGGILEDVEVDPTDEPTRLLAIRATVTSRAQTLQDVSRTLRQAWTALAYAEFEASSCEWYEDGTILRFVTAMRQGGGVFVSGEVIAQGGPYAQLVERFEHDFGDMHGGLAPMPKREP
jgi:hypothetical protein